MATVSEEHLREYFQTGIPTRDFHTNDINFESLYDTMCLEIQ